MRCKCLQSVALATALLAVLASRSTAADDTRQPTTTSQSSGSLRITEAGETQITERDVIENPALVSPAKPSLAIPTPAKRKLAAESLPLEPPVKSDPISQSATKMSPAAEQAADKAVKESLQPIPEPSEGAPVAVEAASFKGVTPGTTVKQDVEKAWGKAKQATTQNGSLVQLFAVEPFNRVEVNYSGDKVSSVLIRFDQPFPADAVAKQLDLAAIRPVPVSNELGEILGVAYPERGVLFAFEPSERADKPSMKVTQIILESITAEAFVLRAETALDSHPDLSLRDLDQALSLEPDNGRAHWLRSRVLMAREQYEKAADAAGKATRIEPGNPQYHVTFAKILGQLGRLPEAIEEAQQAVQSSQNRPHVKARALCTIGDLLASGVKPDYKKAITFHTQAIQLADPLSTDPHPAIRMAAKEVLIDAHLGAAHDIAWGEWKEKEKAVTRWLERALQVALDLVGSEGASQDVVFRVHCRTLAAYVGVRGTIDHQATVKAVVATGDDMIAAAGDPLRKARLQLDVGTALYDAVQICQMRTDHDSALKYGDAAVQYLTKACAAKPSPASSFLLGRLYFRLGAIHAMHEHDHAAAIVWFDKAVPLLDRASPEEFATDLGRHGEAFISMGVSYWETGKRQKAVELTQNGIKWMEQAVKQGTLDDSSLAIPYNNLAKMHRQLGAPDQADRFQEMASRVKKENLK